MPSPLPELLAHDPIPWILESDEPFARWVALTQVLDRPTDDSDVIAAHDELIRDAVVLALVGELPPWGEEGVPGHDSPKYLPNRLNLLADMGVGKGDFEQVEERLDAFLSHQDEEGRFEFYGRVPRRPAPDWGSLMCDTNVIADVLIRLGRGESSGVKAALKRMEKDSGETPQGRAWRCVPEKKSLWRGPGRKADVCPQVTLEGLRAFSHAETGKRPEWLLETARTALEVWRRRTDERPYSFGHGFQFKSVKWPNFWYDVLWLVETLGRYPEVWGSGAQEEDRRAMAELAACLISYNIDESGRVVPRRTYRGFERCSFGQKKKPSPYATARVLAALRRLEGLADDILRVDVEALTSSKGGTGTPVPPKGKPPLCPVPGKNVEYTMKRVLSRMLIRHHIRTPWLADNPGTVVGDVAGLHANNPATPYLSLRARLTEFSASQLDEALYDSRSLVRLRCMRGATFVMKRDLVGYAFAATRRQTSKFAREYGYFRGITDALFERLAPEVLELTASEPLTAMDVRERLSDTLGVDVAALVNRMSTECLLLRDRPGNGWLDRKWTYVPFASALPEVDLAATSEEEGDEMLVRTYVRAFGPATVKDAGWWTGIGARRVEGALGRMGDEVVSLRIEGSDEEHLMHASDIDELVSGLITESPRVVLLPSSDPLMIGYVQKDRFVTDSQRPYVFDRAGVPTSVVLLDGRVAGVWDVGGETKREIRIYPFGRMDAITTAIVEEQAEPVGEFWYGEEVPVVWQDQMTPLARRPAGAAVKPLRD